MRPRTCWLRAARAVACATVCAAACGDSTSDDRPDAGAPALDGGAPVIMPPDEGTLATVDFVEMPALPRLSGIMAAPPNPGPCPAEWTTVPLDDGHYCDAPTTANCGSGEYADLQGGCQRFGASCPNDGWPPGLAAPAVFVDPAATPGGDGQRGSPYASLSEALAAAADNAVIALRRGVHESPPITIDRNLTLVGACASETELRVTGMDESMAALRIRDGSLRELTLTAARPGLLVGAFDGEVTGRANLDTVVMVDLIGVGVGVSEGSQLDARNLWIRNVQKRPSDQENGIFVLAIGGRVDVQNGIFEDGSYAGIWSTAGAHITLEQSAIRRVQPDVGTYGFGLLTSNGGMTTLRAVVVEGAHGIGMLVNGADSTVEAEGVVLRDVVTVDLLEDPTGAAVWLESGGKLRMRGGAMRGVGPQAVVANDPESELTLTDAWIGDVDALGGRPVAALVRAGSRAAIDRLWISHPGGILFVQPGTTGAIQNFVLRPPNPMLSMGNIGMSFSEGAVGTATAVDIADTSGVTAFGADTRVRVRGLNVRQNRLASFAAAATDGATLEVRDAVLDDAVRSAIGVVDAAFTGEDILVRRPGLGVSTTGGTLRLARVQVDDAINVGVALSDARAEIEDLTVDGLASRDLSVGAFNTDVATTATVARGYFTDITGHGATIMEGSKVTLRDVRFEATRGPTRDTPFGLFVSDADGTAVDVTRMAVDGFFSNVTIDGRGVVRDLRSTGRSTTVGFGGAGTAQLSRARLTNLSGLGLHAYGAAMFAVQDVVIDTISPNDIGFSSGMAVADDAQLSAERVRVSASRTSAVLATRQAQLTLRDFQVVEPLLPTCPLRACGIESIAAGLYLQQNVRADVERFEIRRAATAGILLRDNAEIDARVGTIAECGFGLLSERSTLEGAAVTDRVSFANNGRDVLTEAEDYPLIEPARPDPPVVDSINN